MKDFVIQSERSFQLWPSWHVIYEWEDQISQTINCEVIDLYHRQLGVLLEKFRKVLRKAGFTKREFFFDNKKTIKLQWIMDAKIYQDYTYKNVIPIFLDFSLDMVDTIILATQDIPFFWVTNKSIYDVLIKKGCNNVFFQPLSIADKYISNVCPYKDIDVIQFGRKNMTLHNYMMKYCSEYPGVEYVYQTEDGSLTYISTTKGNMGKFDTREEYMRLLSRCRISLVSTPGIDKSKDFGGIDFVTPRFYESAANYCHMVGRYTDNEEAKCIQLSDICVNIQDYEEFKREINTLIAKPCNDNVERFSNFLTENVTSKRANCIKEVLERFL